MSVINRRVTEEEHPVMGLAPVADFNDTVQSTQAVSMANWGKAVFYILKGVGTTGTSTITVEACSNAAASSTSAIPFTYRSYATASSDVPSTDPTVATASGFTTTAGSAQLYVVEVDSDALVASGYNYVRLKCTEVVNSPVLGGILISLRNPRYLGVKAPTTVIA